MGIVIRVRKVGRVRRVKNVRLRHGNCLRTVDVKPSILRTRLVPSEIIRRQKFTETAEENKVEQATVRPFLYVVFIRVKRVENVTIHSESALPFIIVRIVGSTRFATYKP